MPHSTGASATFAVLIASVGLALVRQRRKRAIRRSADDYLGWLFRSSGLATIVAVLAAAAMPGGPPAPGGRAAAASAVVVQGRTVAEAAGAVRAVGGKLGARLDLLAGVAADVTAPEAAALEAHGLLVTPDRPARVAAAGASEPAAATGAAVQRAALDPDPAWSGNGGAGVGVALVDTGVADSPDLAGRLVRGPDLSGEGDGLDQNGHGTFMAGLIAGAATGVAPGATVVSVKVAGRDGTTSMSKLLAGIEWVVDHAEEQHIGVLNLSFGVDAPGVAPDDPLSVAVEQAWAAGITVVAAAGNDGAGEVTSPGADPWIITAGATDPHGTAGTADDTVPTWSGWRRAGPFTKPDVMAPGVSVVSLRAPGSLIDDQHPSARVGTQYFAGSGTSMATALVAGGAADLLADHPLAVPDEIKGALVATSHPLAGPVAGAADLAAADHAPWDAGWWQEHPVAGDTAGAPRRIPWTEDGQWSSFRWSSFRWSSFRWSSFRWSSFRWSSFRWSSFRWSVASWYGETAPWGGG